MGQATMATARGWRAGNTPGAIVGLASLAVVVVALALVVLGVTGGEVVATLLFAPVFAVGLISGRKAGYGAAAVATGAYLALRAGDLSGAGVASAGVMVLTRAAAYVVAGHVGALVRTYLDPEASHADRAAAGAGRGPRPPEAAVEWEPSVVEAADDEIVWDEHDEPALAGVGAQVAPRTFEADQADYGDVPMTMSGGWPPEPRTEPASWPSREPAGGDAASSPGGPAADERWPRDPRPPTDDPWARPDDLAPDPWDGAPVHEDDGALPGPWDAADARRDEGAPPDPWGAPANGDGPAPPDPWGAPANGAGSAPPAPWDGVPTHEDEGAPPDPWGPPANGDGSAPPDPWGPPANGDGSAPVDPWGAPPRPDPATQPPGPPASPWSGLSNDTWSATRASAQPGWDGRTTGETRPVDDRWAPPPTAPADDPWRQPPADPDGRWGPATAPTDRPPPDPWAPQGPPPPAPPPAHRAPPAHGARPAPIVPPVPDMPPVPPAPGPVGHGGAAPIGGSGVAPEQPRLPAVDPETGLWTAQFLRDRLSVERARSRRTGQPCSLVLVQVPDGPLAQLPYRRQVTLLRELGYQFVAGGVVDHMVHVPDQQQHWFAVIMPDTDHAGAQVLERRLRLGIGGYLASRGLPLRDLQSASLTSPDDDAAMGQIWDALIGPDGDR